MEVIKQKTCQTKPTPVRRIENNECQKWKIKYVLENMLLLRNQSLTQSNSQLISNKNQLEQFAYKSAHNIKAPTARLIGLGILFERNSTATFLR
jgi:hypothetical protein